VDVRFNFLAALGKKPSRVLAFPAFAGTTSRDEQESNRSRTG
jgi:hypothetical protein